LGRLTTSQFYISALRGPFSGTSEFFPSSEAHTTPAVRFKNQSPFAYTAKISCNKPVPTLKAQKLWILFALDSAQLDTRQRLRFIKCFLVFVLANDFIGYCKHVAIRPVNQHKPNITTALPRFTPEGAGNGVCLIFAHN
jgi:hypothetical protein